MQEAIVDEAQDRRNAEQRGDGGEGIQGPSDRMTYPAGGRIPTTGSIRSLNFGSVEILSVLRRGDQRRGLSATARRTGNPMASGREECTVGARSGQGAGQAHTRSSGDSIRSADWWAACRPIADLQAPQLSASKGSAPPVRGFPGPSTQSAVADRPLADADASPAGVRSRVDSRHSPRPRVTYTVLGISQAKRCPGPSPEPRVRRPPMARPLATQG
jgi:hypothetical protein